ncbi:MAG: hypothetical protein ACT6RL_05055 [Neoaquamicrobium sediminum]|uniref:hypothetical protein n=1 Tax=Neoaquamicrobium sediminum TaxID=1849104 RepID=UPI0040356403
MSEPAIKHDEIERATDGAIAACGGAREAVKALLLENAQLQDELAMAVPAVSYGYSKGWHARRRSVE